MSRYIAGTKDRMSDLDFYHPVGELYITLSDINPGTRWGGTWELMSEGQFPMSAGSNYLAGDTGGYADQINVAHTPMDLNSTDLVVSATMGGGDSMFQPTMLHQQSTGILRQIHPVTMAQARTDHHTRYSTCGYVPLSSNLKWLFLKH